MVPSARSRRSLCVLLPRSSRCAMLVLFPGQSFSQASTFLILLCFLCFRIDGGAPCKNCEEKPLSDVEFNRRNDMPRKTPGREKDRVAAPGQWCSPRVCREPASCSQGNPAPFGMTNGAARFIKCWPYLHLDEGDCIRAACNDIDLAPFDPIAQGKDAIAFHAQDHGRKAFGKFTLQIGFTLWIEAKERAAISAPRRSPPAAIGQNATWIESEPFHFPHLRFGAQRRLPPGLPKQDLRSVDGTGATCSRSPRWPPSIRGL